MIEELLPEIVKQGFLGVLLAIIGYAYFKKDQEIGRVRDDRLTDLKEIKDQYFRLAMEIKSTLDNLSSLIKGGGR
jgi:hypothetical protein